MKRRNFLQYAIGGIPVLFCMQSFYSCKRDSLAHIKGSIVGANVRTGHLLHNTANFPQVSEQRTVDVLIVGGGVAGLSARRWLQQQGVKDVLMLELDNNTGGNAAYGSNAVSAYPWGAHYLPVPDVSNKELLQFLEQSGVITGYADGLPVYNEYHLCHDPEERLYINGHWQEGLVPDFGVPEDDKVQIQRFFQAIDNFKQSKGTDDLFAFSIPVDTSSTDSQFRKLDRLSFTAWLKQENYTSKYLLWYLEYACKDDYGCTLQNTSAWAGIHYFASRRGTAANANHSSVLTWPEGNGFLTDHLKKQADSTILSNHLVYDVQTNDGHALVKVYDTQAAKSIEYKARKVLMATPQFVNSRLLSNLSSANHGVRKSFSYAPWMTAAITLDGMPPASGMPLCWDNVFYGQPSVGYINANHQNLDNKSKRVLSFYMPLCQLPPAQARQQARSLNYKDWLKMIIDEMEYAQNGITKHIRHADVWIWGHGMIAPTPGFIWGEERKAASQPIDNTIFFAHSDLSGISIFEEAFYQGICAARQIIEIS